MHLIDSAKATSVRTRIVGAGIPIALGAAMPSNFERTPSRAQLFGDGATNIGDVPPNR